MIRSRRRRLTIAAITALGLLTLAALLPVPGIGQTDTPFSETVTVTAAAEVEIAPDLAAVVFGVSARSDSAAAAMDEMARKQNQVFDALLTFGLTEDEVTTGDVSLSRKFVYDRQLDRRIFVGYVAKSTIRAETANVEQIGEIIDVGVDAGADSVRGIDFEATDQNAAIQEALAEAMDLAKLKAQVLAERAGRTLGRALVIEEGGAQTPRHLAPEPNFAAAAGGIADFTVRISPPDEITRVRIIVTFALQ
jgi:uncharacterized protein YggE